MISEELWSSLATVARLQGDLVGEDDMGDNDAMQRDALHSRLQEMLTNKSIADVVKSASPHVAASMLRFAKQGTACNARCLAQVVVARCVPARKTDSSRSG